MNVTETANEGLHRAWRVIVPAVEIDSTLNQRLAELGRTIKMPGFRPGKVPLGIVRKRYGSSVLGEVLEKTVQDSSAKLLEERDVRPALQPKIEVVNFAEGTDLEYTMAVETLPEIEPSDLTGLALERLVVPVTDEAVDAALERLAKANRAFVAVETPRPAEPGDQLIIDFAGSLDGVARPEMAGTDYPLELGSGSFIAGFEDQLVGLKPGETRTVTLTFPGEYHAADLAGKEAVFEVTAKELRAPVERAIDDELAKALGQEDVAALRQAVRTQIEREYGQYSRLKLKRALLDALAERHDFPVPQGMVDLEFDSILRQLKGDAETSGEAEPDDAAKAEYRQIAERRVRLGLLLSEIGKRGNVQVPQEEVNRALIAEARRHPGQEREVFELYRNNPRALDALRAPLYEDKVVDHILETVTLSDRPVSVEELTRDDDVTEPAESVAEAATQTG
jgi:trigger factor